MEYRGAREDNITKQRGSAIQVNSRNGLLAPLGRGFMQTLAFLWYELIAAKRHVKEAIGESQQCGKADLSFLDGASASPVIDKRAQRRWHLSLRWITRKEAAVAS